MKISRLFSRLLVVHAILLPVLLTGLSVQAGSPSAEYVYYELALKELVFEESDPAELDDAAQNLHEAGTHRLFGDVPGFERYPYVFIEDGVAFVGNPGVGGWGTSPGRGLGDLRIGLRIPPGALAQGILFYPKKGGGFLRLDFALPEDRQPGEPEAFYRVMEEHYGRLLAQGIPGSTFFRVQWRVARAGRGADADADPPSGIRGFRGSELEETFGLFTGSRAVAENLALDDELRIEGDGGTPSVALDGVAGITTPEFDWERIEIAGPEREDPLAGLIPGDQHGLFFGSFDGWKRFRHEYAEAGLPILDLVEFPGEFEGILERYERQLLLDGETLAEMKGRAGIGSLAVTGGDPYLPSGAAVTVLVETDDPGGWVEGFRERTGTDRVSESGTYLGREWREVRSSNRRIHAITVALDGAVAITNSRHQKRRIIETANRDIPALNKTNDYRYFRERYKPGAETGFLVISDATIRRWGRPEARIANSRRTRAAAALMELQVANRNLLLEAAEHGLDEERAIHRGEADSAGLRNVVLDPGGSLLRDSVYNTMDFLTPVDELDLEKATSDEVRAYQVWRNRYQGRWGDIFCPITLRFDFSDEKVIADLMVFPLIEQSAFREFIEVAGKNEISAGDGDPHPEAMLHFVVSVDPDSEPLRNTFRAMRGMLGEQLDINPLDWIRSSVALYVDDGFFWEAAANASDPGRFFGENFAEAPVGIHIASRSSARLAVFLAGFRGFLDQTAPGLLEWTTREHNEREYVVVRPRERFFGGGDFSLHYATLPGALVASLREDVITNAIDRANRRAATPREAPFEWPGKHLNMRVRHGVFPVLTGIFDTEAASNTRRAAWRQIPILNEWKRWYPERDPVAVHETVYGIPPGFGDAFEWNDAYKTAASVRWGHPGEPAVRDGGLTGLLGEIREAVFGVTFEMDGLSARAEISRGTEAPETAAFVHPEEAGEPVDLRGYFPIREGARWRYRERQTFPSDFRMEDETIIQNVEVLEAEETDRGTLYPLRYVHTTVDGAEVEFPEDATYWHTAEPDVVIYRFEYDSGEGPLEYAEPLLVLPGEMIPGKTYSRRYRSGVSTSGDEETIGMVHLRLTGFEDITVPAGEFENSARVEVVHEYLMPGSDWFGRYRGVLWYAESVGELRSEWSDATGFRSVMELEAYEGPQGSGL